MHVYYLTSDIVNLDAIASICFTDCMTSDLKHTTLAAWISLIRASERAIADIEAAFKDKNLPPLSWYDALLEIEKAGEDGVRPYELRDRLLMPQYGTSRLLARIVKDGYIRKAPCKLDGRGHVVQITTKGKSMRKLMWPIYAECLKRAVEEPISPSDAEALRKIVDRIAPRNGAVG